MSEAKAALMAQEALGVFIDDPVQPVPIRLPDHHTLRMPAAPA